MKKIALAAALSLAATSAFAGSHSKMGKYSDPVVEPVIEHAEVVEETRAGSGGIIVPIMLLLVVAAAVASR
ncbi:MAG: hypothetical protein JJU09_12230 [Rhodobacteraceae bacterium]|jgi:hypothetical protein|nr:hypothetical protein [Paracoccaceae bacterium]TVR46188.1 MAG: hypothetical protein EA386_10725 [Paracoccaceae bacterium]